MPNRDSVIYDINRCTCNVPDACRDCSHYTGTVGFRCMEDLLKDALALLNEQEKPNGKCANECECLDSAYERGKQDALKEQDAVKKCCRDCEYYGACHDE